MLTDTGVGAISHIIQLSVAPVFLLTAVGSFLVVLTNRLSRNIDRSRYIAQQMHSAAAQNFEHQSEYALINRRIRIIYVAIGLCTCSGLLVCLDIALLFIGTLFSVRLENFVAVLFIICMFSLFTALLCFLSEVYLATTRYRQQR